MHIHLSLLPNNYLLHPSATDRRPATATSSPHIASLRASPSPSTHPLASSSKRFFRIFSLPSSHLFESVPLIVSSTTIALEVRHIRFPPSCPHLPTATYQLPSPLPSPLLLPAPITRLIFHLDRRCRLSIRRRLLPHTQASEQPRRIFELRHRVLPFPRPPLYRSSPLVRLRQGLDSHKHNLSHAHTQKKSNHGNQR